MDSNLFRKSSIERISSPEQLFEPTFNNASYPS